MFDLIPCPRILTFEPGFAQLKDVGNDGVALASALVREPDAAAASLGLTLERYDLKALSVRVAFTAPEGLETTEGYLLVVEDQRVLVGAETPAGHRHALRTLAQLVVQAPKGRLPNLRCADWPALGLRGFNLCYHLVHHTMPLLAPSYETALQTIELFAALKMNACLLEPESMFPWKDNVLRSQEAFTSEQIAGLRHACEVNGIEIIPLVQSIGHAYHVLRHREYSHLRELPDTSQQYCITNPQVLDFYESLATEVAQALGSRRFHLGGDESRRLGKCPRCASKAKEVGLGGLYAEHVNQLARRLTRHGLCALVWGDIMEDHPEIHEQLDPNIAVIYWNYDAVDWNRPYCLESYGGRGRTVYAGTAARFSLQGDATFLYKRAMRNQSVMTGEAVRNGLAGLIVTDWTKIAPPDPARIATGFGAEQSWHACRSQEDFARRWAKVNWGVDFPKLDTALALISEYSLKQKDVMNPHFAPPLVDFTVHYMPDWLDRYDWSQWNFAQLLADYARQERVEQARVQLAEGQVRAQTSLALFDQVEPPQRDARSYGVVRLGAVVQRLKCRLGLALLDALALLKFPRKDDREERNQVALRLRELVPEWTDALDSTRALLAPAVPPASLEAALKLKFDPQALATAQSYAALLEGNDTLHGSSLHEVWK